LDRVKNEIDRGNVFQILDFPSYIELICNHVQAKSHRRKSNTVDELDDLRTICSVNTFVHKILCVRTNVRQKLSGQDHLYVPTIEGNNFTQVCVEVLFHTHFKRYV
jgi:hypothetical protein